MNEERLMTILTAMFARQWIMTKTLIELLEERQPITWNGFLLEFHDSWKKDATSTMAAMCHRFDQDDLKLLLKDLGKMEDQEPPTSGEGNDD